MQLPTVTAFKLLQSANFEWIDQMFRDGLPEEVGDVDDQTIVDITEWLNEPAYYANKTFKGWNIGVEIQIFYSNSLPAEFNMMDAEIKLADLFKKDNWNIEQSKNHIQDPDTGQVSKVFYFSKILLIKEKK